jgi:transposase
LRSSSANWRKARDAGAAAGLTDRRQAAARAVKKAENAELSRLQRENARLQAELAKTQTALQIMGKAHALLELLSESADTAPMPNPPSPRRSRR